MTATLVSSTSYDEGDIDDFAFTVTGEVGDVVIVALCADRGGQGRDVSLADGAEAAQRLGSSTDANPVSAIYSYELTGSPWSPTFTNAGSSIQKCCVEVAVYRGISRPTSAIRTSGSGLGDPGSIFVGTDQVVIATGHVDDDLVSNYGPPPGMTMAGFATHDGGGGSSATVGIAHDFSPPAEADYDPSEFTGSGNDSDDAYIMVADVLAVAGGITGAFEAGETGQDTASGAALVAASGAFAAQESGSDALYGAGTVATPGVTGSMAAGEADTDALDASGGVESSATFLAVEGGPDSASGAATSTVTGQLVGQEIGSDAFSISGSVHTDEISGVFSGHEAGQDRLHSAQRVSRGAGAASSGRREQFWREEAARWVEEHLPDIEAVAAQPKRRRRREAKALLGEMDQIIEAQPFVAPQFNQIKGFLRDLAKPKPDYSALADAVAREQDAITQEKARKRRQRDIEAVLILAA